MTSTRPPRLAAWILDRVARGNEPLVGDVLEAYEQHASAWWFWKQVLQVVFIGTPRVARLVFLIAGIYVAGAYIQLPGARPIADALMSQRASGNGPWRLFSLTSLGGGSLTWGTVFTLGINPYISAACLVVVLHLVWTWINRHAEHRRRMPVARITWCVALVLCITEAAGFVEFIERVSRASAVPIITASPWTFRIGATLMMTAGTMGLMLISEWISRHQLGNGMLIVYLTGTLTAVLRLIGPLLGGAMDPVGVGGMLALSVAMAGFVSWAYQRALTREAVV